MMGIRKQFRGISKRLAVHYLQQLGGRAVDGDGDPVENAGSDPEAAAAVERVVADGWTASVSTEPVAIGPSLTLTQVNVSFEGETDLEGLVQKFSQKAMRAGG